jgi:valyl-tRNA synthetase
MSEISKTYDPKDVEAKWYQYWMEHKLFRSTPDPNKEPYTIVIPPPNVTGVLHMGHMLNNTIQDVLIRRARMQGKNACWVPGTDHASIATEAKVVAMLKEQGIEKKDISREQFLEHAFAWKDKYGGIILEQLKKLGASCDWDRTRFTMEEELSKAVIDSFVQLHRRGWIYKGVRMVNWDPQGKTALSDEEVIFKTSNTKMVYFKYRAADNPDEFLTVATVRPETIPGDVAVCVNPNDERYQSWIGRKVLVPLLDREVPVIADEYVDPEFGTGILKITPAHDVNDYNIGQKYNLPAIDTIADDGTMSEAVGIAKYIGQDRFRVRKAIIQDLEEAGLLVKVEDHSNQVGTSERTGAVIEPKLSMQWWLKMEDIARPAFENVMNDTIRFFPEKFKNMYRSWMENPKDWCISRQLWWGQQIPAYYDDQGNIFVANTKAEAYAEYQALCAQEGRTAMPFDAFRQDEDVLDTWFSSWLWPISVFDGFKDPNNADIQYYYPTAVLVTGFDIIFFWVARMIMAGYAFKGELPFKDVYFTGLIRDKMGRKMSKSLGNSPDALRLIDLYSADGVRFGVLFSSAAGNDLLFDTGVPKSQKQEDITAFMEDPESHNSKLCEQGRNFANKIWNSYRLLSGWEVDESLPFAHAHSVAWLEERLQQALAEIDDHFSKYRISDALQTVYKLFWDDFCAWYLEIIKPEYGQPIDRSTLQHTLDFFERLLQLTHPFMPFITEELWQQVRPRAAGESICIAPYPAATRPADQARIQAMDQAFEIVIGVRQVRNQKEIAPKVPLKLFAKADTLQKYTEAAYIIRKMAVLESFDTCEAQPEQTVSFLVKGEEFFVHVGDAIDLDKEREKLQKELEYAQGFRDSVLKKLGNERFVANAKPDVVQKEREKLADAEANIQALSEALKKLA